MIEVFRRFFEEHRRALLAVLAVVVGNALFYFLLTAPAQLRARSLRRSLEAADTELGKALREYGTARLESQLFHGADETLARLYSETFQTNRERFPIVDAKIKELAARFRLEPRTIGYSYTPMQKERLEQLRISFNLKGTYTNLRHFIAEVEQARDAESGDLFFAIEQISLVDSSESGQDLNLTIALTTYFHRPELAALDPERIAKRRSR